MADSKEKYYEAIGRRKTSVARVRLYEAGRSSFIVNDKKLDEYFKTATQSKVASDALKDAPSKFKISVKVYGGGLPAQAEAIRLGVARALIKFDESLRKDLKVLGFLKRDPRKKERKKFGLKKARRSPQWSKR